jgi:hypothetical protein
MAYCTRSTALMVVQSGGMTPRRVETANGVKAQGSSIGSRGATVAGGMVFVTSGYTGFIGGHPGTCFMVRVQHHLLMLIKDITINNRWL